MPHAICSVLCNLQTACGLSFFTSKIRHYVSLKIQLFASSCRRENSTVTVQFTAKMNKKLTSRDLEKHEPAAITLPPMVGFWKPKRGAAYPSHLP